MTWEKPLGPVRWPDASTAGVGVGLAATGVGVGLAWAAVGVGWTAARLGSAVGGGVGLGAATATTIGVG